MRALLVTLLLAGCNPPEAPTELSDLARYVIREFDNDDPAFLQAGATNLATLLDAVDYEADTVARSTIPTGLQAEDVVGLTRPADTELEDTADVSLYYRSRHPVAAHADYTRQADQLDAEPTATAYMREFLEGRDCFGNGDCEHLRTVNDLTRENLLFSMQFELWKDFRRLQTEDGRAVMVSRAWTQEGFLAHVGTANLRQSWTLDVWLDEGEGSERLRVNWAETTFDPPIDEDIIRNTTRAAIQDALEAGDDALDL